MRVLLAEDDSATAQFIEEGLANAGHKATVVETGGGALESLASGNYDVVILDRLMPDGDGIAVLNALRGRGCKVPVLMLTALGQITKRVEGLVAGADDYLVKPFDLSELIARIHALHRRAGDGGIASPTPATTLVWGGLSLDLLRRTVTYCGRDVVLFPREFRILEELARACGETLTRTMLLERVWGFHFDPKTNLVETHLSRLRTKLADAGCAGMIGTVRGVGYRLRGDA
ncbi:response regulator transcription factor [Sphingomonas nostoxanthinifaciens]|nr:response regulator transcription factor [Sphingomonas nostoxanthinifaciens]